jgi:hypothetical protein
MRGRSFIGARRAESSGSVHCTKSDVISITIRQLTSAPHPRIVEVERLYEKVFQ